ncbi:MAG: sugar phosphate isomerase/epimerase [Caldilineaceae bacterium]|nr:sugar phosphate isomerase/epimerase [Caldilineaceae bacterium]
MRLGYMTWGMPTVPIDVALCHLSELGYDGVEITVIPGYTTELSTLDSSERKRIAGLLKQYNLALPAVAGHTPLLTDTTEGWTKNLDRLKRTVDLCADWETDEGIPVLDTTVGGRPEEWEARCDLLVERVQELAEYAASRSVVLAIEHHVGSILNTPQTTVELIERVARENVKVNFDISHFNVIGVPIEESVRLLTPITVHTHVKDETGRAPDHQFLIPGEGVFDYVTYLKAMRRHGYKGFISPEISIMVQRRPDYDPLAAATRTYEVLSRAFVEAGIER